MAIEVSQPLTTRPGLTTARAAEDPEKTPQPAPAPRSEDEDRADHAVEEVDPARLGEAVERANRATESLASSGRLVRFEVHEPTGDVVVKVLEEESEEIVRQIPPEEFLAMAHQLRSVLLDVVA